MEDFVYFDQAGMHLRVGHYLDRPGKGGPSVPIEDFTDAETTAMNSRVGALLKHRGIVL